MSTEPQASTGTGDNAGTTTGETANTLLGGEAKSGQTNTNTPAQETNNKDGQTSTPPEGTKPAEKQVGEVKKGGVPEKYEFKLPEGTKIGDTMLDKFTGVAKDLGLSQENAQKLVDLAMENATAQVKENVDAWDKQRQDWVAQLKADKEFGGDKLGETITRAKRALSTFSDPSFVDFLEQSGFGDNIHLIKFLAKVDAKIGEDKVHDGQGGANTKNMSAAEIIYGNKKQ